MHNSAGVAPFLRTVLSLNAVNGERKRFCAPAIVGAADHDSILGGSRSPGLARLKEANERLGF
jgi:hypothetical protein